MSFQTQTAVQTIQDGVEGIPENAPFRESSSPEAQEKGRIVEVEFSDPKPRFRESFTMPPRKVRNAERRSREFLTPAEVESLIDAAEKLGRHGHRDATMILIAYRHALRVSELVSGVNLPNPSPNRDGVTGGDNC
jgi:hypothetical protein